MSHSGTIKLIWHEKVNNQANYSSTPERNKIINMWRDIYGMEFEKCAVQIKPDINDKKK